MNDLVKLKGGRMLEAPVTGGKIDRYSESFTLFIKLGITMLIDNKDDIELVTEFPCFLGHPVIKHNKIKNMKTLISNIFSV